MMKKTVFIVLLAIMVLSGCSGKGSKDNLILDLGDEAVISNSHNKTLTVYLPQTNDILVSLIINIFKDAVAEYEKQNPNTKVIIDTTIPFEQYEKNLIELKEKNQSPDIVLVTSERVQLLAEENLLLDLIGLAEAENLDADDFFRPAVEQLGMDGRWYGLPFSIDPLVIFYNKELFDNAGIPYPSGNWTWEQFYSTSIKLREANPAVDLPTYGGITMNNLYSMEALILSKGGRILSPDGKQMKGYLDSPEAVKAVQYMVDLYRNQKMEDAFESATSTYGWGRNFMSNQLGMFMINANNRSYLDYEMKDKLGMVPLPSFENGHRVNIGSVTGLGITEQSQNVTEAWRFLKMILMEDNEFTQRIFELIVAPSRSISISSGQMDDPALRIVIDEIEFYQKYAGNRNLFYYEAMSNIGIDDLIDDMFRGEVDVQSQLTNIAELMDNEFQRLEAAKKNNLEEG